MEVDVDTLLLSDNIVTLLRCTCRQLGVHLSMPEYHCPSNLCGSHPNSHLRGYHYDSISHRTYILDTECNSHTYIAVGLPDVQNHHTS